MTSTPDFWTRFLGISSFTRRSGARALLAALLLWAGAAAAQDVEGTAYLTPEDGAVLETRSVTLRGRVDADVRLLKIDGEAVPLDGGAFETGPLALREGERAFLIWTQNEAGETASWTHRLVVDTLAPQISVQSPTGRLHRGAVRLVAQVDDPHLEAVELDGRPLAVRSGRIDTELSLAEGVQSVVLVARDALGHESRRVLDLELDTTPPAVEILADGRPLVDGAVFSRAVRLGARAEDGALELFVDGETASNGVSVEAEGAHRVEAVATDAAGNVSRRSAELRIDRTPPRFTADAGAPKSATGTETVSTAADTYLVQGRVEGATEVWVDGRRAELVGDTYRAGPFALNEGEQAFEIRAVDGAGNEAGRSLVVKNDPAAPSLQVVWPTQGAVVGSSPITVAGSAIDADLASVAVDGQAATLNGANWSLDGVVLVEGSQVLNVVATDAVGNASSQAVTVILDTVAPVPSFVAGGAPLTDGAVFAGFVTPDAVAVDATAVTFDATLDGLAWTPGTTVDSLGQHNLSVTATDAAGNSASAAVTFTVEGAPPVFGAVSPASGTVLDGPSVTLIGHVDGAVALTVDGQNVALERGGEFVAGPFTLSEGSRTFTLVATSAGGQTAQLAHGLVADFTAPPFPVPLWRHSTTRGKSNTE